MRRVGPVAWFLVTEGALSALLAGTFTVVGVYYVSEVGLDPLQLVLIGTVMEVTAFVFEIPTGVVADTYSRRASLIVGWALHGATFVVIGLFPSYEAILVASALSGVAFTFESGAYEAWITDEVGAERVGPIFVRGARVSYVGALAGIGACVAIAAWLDLRTAIVVGGLFGVALAVASVFLMPETGFRRTPPEEREGWGAVLGTAASGFRLVRAQRLLLLMLAITFFAGMSTEALDRLWQAHFLRDIGLPRLGELDPIWWFAVFRVGELLLGLVGTTFLLRRIQSGRAPRLARTLLVLTVAQGVAIVVFGVAGGLLVGLLGFWLYNLTRQLTQPLFMTWLNQSITDSSVRATVISMSGQADAIGQAGGGPLIGALGNVLGIRAAMLASAAVLTPALALYARALRHHGRPPELAGLAVAPSATDR
ncbi:MAG: MFS transporter [Thermoleophilia bacterium]|nr:MFS transporter [Thermoleophilia bacterium]MDH4346356.1 MFS transporter [Thermoleophilia bacterium]MDH5334204.1 MFS transporter [Thermoleophilia bacterium]